ncbi:MAG: hypothetical protein ACTSUE_02125 [Promethearchaeota archaeon]
MAGTSLGNNSLANEVSVSVQVKPINVDLIVTIIIISVIGGLSLLNVLDKKNVVKIPFIRKLGDAIGKLFKKGRKTGEVES